MARTRLPRILLSGLFLMLISGCAYPISREMREKANEKLTFSQVVENPEAFTGNLVIWGGLIMEISNPSDGGEITVLQGPLDSDEYPNGTISDGEFIAKASTFLDPMIYTKGKKITLAGEIVGKKVVPSGVMLFTYPVVSMKEVFLWSKKREWWEPPSYSGWKWDFYTPYFWPFSDDDLANWDYLK